jgi:hypothetical protein
MTFINPLGSYLSTQNRVKGGITMNCPQCEAYRIGINQLAEFKKKEREEDRLNRAHDENRLNNILSYASLIQAALETAGGHGAHGLPKGWKVVSRQTWDDIGLMLFHINNTVHEMLPEEVPHRDCRENTIHSEDTLPPLFQKN